MCFEIQPEGIWRLSECVEAARRQVLLSKPYQEILDLLVSTMSIVRGVRDFNKNPLLGYEPGRLERYELELRFSSKAIDLFHNGAGGYRAQYLSSIKLGETANRLACDLLRHRANELRTSDDLAGLRDASLTALSAKVWIHQGLWQRQSRWTERNLSVAHWESQPLLDKDARKFARWASLTPENETKLDLIGGWLDIASGVFVGEHKPNRSIQLHHCGFT